jgi:hypothetical protein
MGKYMNREFSEEEIQMANKCMKKFSASLAIKEMKMKTTLRLHPTSQNGYHHHNKCWQGCGEWGRPFYTADGNVN